MTDIIVPSRPARPIVVEGNARRLPPGGTTGQALIKASDSDFATVWGTATAAAAWGAITGTLASQTDLQSALDAKQATLVSGVNIKTLNGSTILGSGDLVVSSSIADGDKGDITVSGSGATWTIDNAVVTNAKLADMPTARFKGRTTAGTGEPEDLTAAQATALLDTFVASGGSHKKGLVPDPGATAGGTRYLNEDGTWTKRPYDLNLFVGGLTTNSELVFRMKATTEFTLPTSLTGSYGTAVTASTGTVAFDLLKNGVSFGTLTFTASATGVFTAASATTFAVGDVLTIVAPASADATLADVSINLKGSAT